MTRVPAAAALVFTFGFATSVDAQQPAPAVGGAPRVGPTGPGLQPQVGTSPYQPLVPLPTPRGPNPYAGPQAYPSVRPAPRFGPRPALFAPPPAPVAAANNPAGLNRGVIAPFPVVIPPAGPAAMPANGFAFNPVLVARPGVPSAYYVPPIPSYAHGPTGESTDTGLPTLGTTLFPVTGLAITPPAAVVPPVTGGAGFDVPPVDVPFFPWAW